MIEIYYLNQSKQEQKITYEDLNEWKSAQMSCNILIPDNAKVTKLIVDGKNQNYSGTFGDVYYFFLNKSQS